MPFITKINVFCHSVFEVCTSLIKLLMVQILSTVYSSLNCIAFNKHKQENRVGEKQTHVVPDKSLIIR